MLCLDGGANILVNILSGWISIQVQAAQSIVCNMLGLFYMSAIGLEQVSSALVGQQLGKNDVVQAKIFYSSLYRMSISLICFSICALYTFRIRIIHMFTDIKEIQVEALYGTYWLLFNLLPDMNKGMLKGVIYALGI